MQLKWGPPVLLAALFASSAAFGLQVLLQPCFASDFSSSVF